MPRKAASVTQADIARVIRAALACGLEVRRIIIQPDGTVSIVTNGGEFTLDEDVSSPRPEMIL